MDRGSKPLQTSGPCQEPAPSKTALVYIITGNMLKETWVAFSVDVGHYREPPWGDSSYMVVTAKH